MATASAPIQINGVHHLALVCKDMARTVDFYTNKLGLRLTKGFDLEGYGQHFFLIWAMAVSWPSFGSTMLNPPSPGLQQ